MWRWGSGTEAEDDVGWPFRVALFCVRRQGDQFWTRNGPPAVSLAGRSGGPFLVAVEAPVVMVGTDRAGVEVALRAGELCCPCCRGALVPWGHARERVLRGDRHGRERLRPRRARCGSCGRTHVLLPVSCLARRADGVAVIGAALTAKAAGAGHRRIAVQLERAVSTVRGWLRVFAARAEPVRSLFTGLLHELDPLAEPAPVTGTGFADAVEAIGAVSAAARRRLGVVGAVSPWQLASAVSGGRLLAPAGLAESVNTSWPWAAAR